jgi:hypothetical protein
MFLKGKLNITKQQQQKTATPKKQTNIKHW